MSRESFTRMGEIAPPGALSEEDILHRLADGNDEALGFLYQRYFHRLVRVLRPLTADTSLAEDIAQDAFLRVKETANRFDPSRPFWPWLRAIAVHLAVDSLRKRSREVAEKPDIVWTLDGIESCEDGLILKQALAHLPGRQRVALGLRYLQQLEPATAAMFMGLSRPAFAQLLRRARVNLKTEFDKLSREVLGLAPIPFRLLGRAGRRLSTRLRRMVTRLEGAEGALPGTLSQLGQALLAVVLVASAVDGAGSGSAPPETANQLAKAQESRTVAAPVRSNPTAEEEAETARDFLTDESQVRSSAQEIAGALTDPNRDVRRPEDAQLTSIAFARNEGPSTVYAAGYTHCVAPVCPTVLFRSEDKGTTWRRMRAEGLRGVSLLTLPSDAPRGQLFAISPGGVEVSENGGRSFETAALANVPIPFGSAAVSPAFASGDPRILIGGRPHMLRYMNDRRTIEPEPMTAGPGPLHPAFSPAFPSDPRIVVGAAPLDPGRANSSSAVFVCETAVCHETRIGEGTLAPEVRLTPDYAESNVAVAFHPDELYLSENGGASFVRIFVPWEGVISDIAVGQSGQAIFAAVWNVADPSDGGLWVSRNGGVSWRQIRSSLLAAGAVKIALFGSTVLVGLLEGGIACSSDGGWTWTPRCSGTG